MDWVALVGAVTALVTAVGGLVALFKHVNAPDPHPKAVTGGQTNDPGT
jgi:hypothetical protein